MTTEARYATVDALSPGDVVCRVTTTAGVTVVQKSLAAVIAVYGVAFGMAVQASAAGGAAVLRTDGEPLPTNVHGLTGGPSFVRLNQTTARPEKVGQFAAGDLPLGYLDERNFLSLTLPANTVGLIANPTQQISAVKTASYNAPTGEVVRVDTTGGVVPVTLPLAAGNAGRSVRVRKVSLGRTAAQVVPQSGELIDGVSARAFDAPLSEATFTSDGVGWLADPPLPHTPAELSPLFWYRADAVDLQGTSCTRWIDKSGNKFHLEAPSAGARPTLKTSLIQPALTFDGSNDEMFYNVAMAASDFPLTLIVISRMNVGSQTGYLVDLTDQTSAHTSLRSCSLFQGEGGTFRVARYPGAGNGAFISFGSTGLVYDYAEFVAGSRQLFQNGVLVESGFGGDVASFNTATPKALNGIRVAGAWAQSAFYQGDIFEVIGVARVLTAGERAYLDRYLLERYGVFPPLAWPFEPATDVVSDPHLILPTTVDAIVGTPLEVLKYNVSRRDGATAKTASCPGQTVVDLVDRWRITPSGAGTSTLTVTEAGFQDSTTVNAVAALAGGAPTRNVLVVGDSISDNGNGVWVQLLKESLGSRITLVGTKTITVGPRTHHSEAYSGQAWGWFATNVADSGSPGASPFAPAGTINIAGYLTTLSDPDPDIIIWALGTNNAFLNNASTIDTALTTAHTHAANLMAAFTAALPNVRHAIVTSFPGRAGHATWRAVHSRDHYDWRQCQVRQVERIYSDFGGQEVSNKRWIIAGHLSVDPVGGYYSTDPLHPNHPIGHVQIADTVLRWLHAHWT